MSTRGRPRKDELVRSGHRKAVGEGTAPEAPRIDEKLIGVEPPDDLWPLAAEVWRIVIADMVALGHLTPAYLTQIRNYAVECAMCIECEASVKEFGTIMKEPITAWSDELQAYEMVGFKLKENPAAQAHTRHAGAVRLIAAELALTPIARIRGNLMAMATASLAIGIKDSIDAEIEAEDAAAAVAKKATRKKPKKTKASKAKQSETKKTTTSKRKKT